MDRSRDSGVIPALPSQPSQPRLVRFEMVPPAMGTEPPKAFLSAPEVDHRDASTWRPAGLEAIRTTVDECLALVRWDLADTACQKGLRCVARIIERAATREEWDMVAADFASARVLVCDSSDRSLLTAAEEAAEELAAGLGDRVRLSSPVPYDGALEWLDDVRATRAERGGAR